jgi:hypothetical protein
MKADLSARVPAGAAALLLALAAPVQAIEGGLPTTAFAAVGTGVQITPDWVLAVEHATPGVGSNYSNGYGGRAVLAVYTAPGSGSFPANDLSLLRLAPAATGVPYLPVNSTPWADGALGPLNVTIASAANTPPARGYAFTQVGESATLFDPDDAGPQPPVTVNWLISLDRSVYVQGGDSGGGLFLGHVVDSSLLLGLSSAQITDAQNLPLGSAFVQPGAYRGWIDATLALDNADTQAVWWVAASAVPEPAGWLLALIGGIWLARGRKPA